MKGNNSVIVFLEPAGVVKPDKDRALFLEGRRIADGLKVDLEAIALKSSPDCQTLCEECGVNVL